MKNKQVKIGNATLYLGDCFSILPKLDVECDALITDPPYGTTNCDWDIKIPLNTFWSIIDSSTKLTANFVLFGCGRFTHELFNSKPDWYRYDMVWVKSKKCGHLNANKMPMRNHESVLVFGRQGFRDAAAYNPQKSLGGRVGVKTVNHKSNVYRDKGTFIHTSDGFLHPGSVLHFKNEIGLHPTQKPLGLMEQLVKTYSNEGDTVLDCFMGSGSTAAAAINTGRKFIGIEQNEKYFNIAVERLKKAYSERKGGSPP